MRGGVREEGGRPLGRGKFAREDEKPVNRGRKERLEALAKKAALVLHILYSNIPIF